MSRYIDANKLNGYEFGLISPKAQKLFHKTIDNAPTEDVKPIVYGKWIKRYVITNTKTIELNVCSECNEEFSYDAETGISMDNYNICPNCGAYMRKESNNKNADCN